ncbi:hypothetical protein, partial [Burkholderia cenocepacia]|uniref:hypothetical protein n=1 Tax=Burkholderia cenocepacia TaxID=95486 RepID=UPI001B98AFB9
NIDLAQLRHDLFGFVLLLGHSNVLLRLNSLLQGGPLFRGQTNFSFYFPDCENKQSATYIQNAIQIRNLAFIKIY